MKMSKTRIFVNKTISSNLLIYIKDKQHHFLKNVLRIKINDEINVFDSKTGEWKSIVIAINRDNTVLRIGSIIDKLKLSKLSEDLLYQVLFTNAYPPKVNLNSEDFLKIK